jgi:hypothetical protein
MRRNDVRRALVIAVIGTACALFLGGAACGPVTSGAPACGGGPGGELDSVLSADHDHVAFRSDRLTPGVDSNAGACDIFVKTLSTGVVERVTSTVEPVGRPAGFSSDGRLVLFNVGVEGRLVDRTTGEVLWSGETGYDRLDLTPDGRYVAWVDGPLFARLDRTTGDVLRFDPRLHGGTSSTAAWLSISDDGASVAVGGTGGTELWDVPGDSLITISDRRTVRARISPDGMYVAYELHIDAVAANEDRVHLWRRATGGDSSVFHSWSLRTEMTWTVEGAWLVFDSGDQVMAGDLPSTDIRPIDSMTFAKRLRDGLVVRLSPAGIRLWPGSSTPNLVISRHTGGTTLQARDGVFSVYGLAP